jgi:hypothetical protein
MSDQDKGIRKLNKTQFSISANKFLNMTRDEITTALNDPKASMLDLLLGGIIAKAVKDSDVSRANFILDRLIPRLKTQDDFDPTLNVQTDVPTEATIPLYVVKINREGRFLESRPTEVARTIDAEPTTAAK